MTWKKSVLNIVRWGSYVFLLCMERKRKWENGRQGKTVKKDKDKRKDNGWVWKHKYIWILVNRQHNPVAIMFLTKCIHFLFFSFWMYSMFICLSSCVSCVFSYLSVLLPFNHTDILLPLIFLQWVWWRTDHRLSVKWGKSLSLKLSFLMENQRGLRGEMPPSDLKLSQVWSS